MGCRPAGCHLAGSLFLPVQESSIRSTANTIVAAMESSSARPRAGGRSSTQAGTKQTDACTCLGTGSSWPTVHKHQCMLTLQLRQCHALSSSPCHALMRLHVQHSDCASKCIDAHSPEPVRPSSRGEQAAGSGRGPGPTEPPGRRQRAQTPAPAAAAQQAAPANISKLGTHGCVV